MLLSASNLSATETTFTLAFDGTQEVPGPGDADGVGAGTITLNDVTGAISWDLTHANIVAPNAMHIHGPNGAPGMSAGVHIGLGVATSGGAGTLIDSLVHPILSDVTDILNDPNDFYVNIHNTPFPGGAIRANLPAVGFPIPTISQWGLIILTILLLTAGTIAFGRKRSMTVTA